jgi:UDP-N-acetylmuramoyl-L-alanyl-D-glutamate--2,6-diaminopimelate ligase
VAVSREIPLPVIGAGIGDVERVAGRLEVVPGNAEYSVVVDYAHTPDALENVLRTVRDMMPDGAALACVVGCGGDRDRAKRPVMGRIAEERADRVVLTNDNPRTEDPDAILAEIRAGMTAPEAAVVIPDRAEAIRRAVADAAPGDVIVIAGKGHETYQIVGTEKRDFDDREHVRQRFRDRAGGGG